MAGLLEREIKKWNLPIFPFGFVEVSWGDKGDVENNLPSENL
jgi:hypothetical protein